MKERVVCRESIEWVDIAPLSLIHLLSKEDDCDQRKGGWDTGDGWVGAVQKIQKLSDSPSTTPMVAKLFGINCKNKKITK